ncbi:hypothetical protein BGX29_006507 [Mortierella sp. GBA35]|nr:hypothetical protein BGX29_006507 [Mortierella sp. GBA35]
MRQPSLSTRFYFTLASSLWFLSNSVYYANGQAPQPCGGPAYAVIGTKFYVHGGALSADHLLQSTWALDLTKSWTTSKPAWTPLALGPYNAYHSGGRSADNKTFITFGRDTAADPQMIPNSFINIYDIASGNWTKEFSPNNMDDVSRRDFAAVTNPIANKVYLLGGNAGSNGATYSNMFTTYDVATETVTEIPTPSPGPQSISSYAAVWSAKLNAMVVIGGSFKAGGNAQGLSLYHPDTGAWTTQTTNGPFNHGRTMACAASNGDGSLIVVFGGFLGNGPGDPAIYVLDTATWTWTTTRYPGQGRGYAACALVDDTFMVWGGYLSSPNTVNSLITGTDVLILYSVSKREWLTTYTPSEAMAGGSPPPGYPTTDPVNNPSSSSPKGLSTGALAGIIAGGVAALAVVLAGIIVWNRRRKHKGNNPNGGKDGTGHGYETAGINSMEEHRHSSGPPRPPLPPGAGSTNQYHSLKLADEALFDPRQSLDGSYGNSAGGYSTATTPTTLDFLNTESSNRSDRDRGGRMSYQSDGSVYYPPPPPTQSISHQPTIPEDSPYMSTPSSSSVGVGWRFNDSRSLPLDTSDIYNYQYAGLTGQSTGPAFAATGSDYHDGYGVAGDSNSNKYMSGVPTQTGYSRVAPSLTGSDPQAITPNNGSSSASPPGPKRIVSGPQGLGDGFSFVWEPTRPGAPQALLEHQRSVVQTQPQSPPPLGPRSPMQQQQQPPY